MVLQESTLALHPLPQFGLGSMLMGMDDPCHKFQQRAHIFGSSCSTIFPVGGTCAIAAIVTLLLGGLFGDLHVSQLLKAFQAQTISGTTWGAVVQSVAHSEHNSQHCVQPLARHHLSACCIHALDGLARSLYDRRVVGHEYEDVNLVVQSRYGAHRYQELFRER